MTTRSLDLERTSDTPPADTTPRERWAAVSERLGPWVLPGLVAAMILVPLGAVVRESAKESVTSLWDRATDLPRIGQTLVNTVVMAAASTVLATVLGVLLAWFAVHLRGRRQRVATLVGIAPILVPGIAGATGWVFIFAPRIGYGNVLLRNLTGSEAVTGPVDVFSVFGIIIVVALYLVPYPMLFALAALRKADPTLAKAAQVSGSSWLGAQVRVMLPLLRPAIIYGAGVVLLLGLGQFVVVLILGRQEGVDVLTTEIYRHLEFYAGGVDYPLASFLGLPIIAAALVMVIVQRWVIGDPLRYVSTSKGVGSAPREIRSGVYPLLGFGLLAVVPPLFGLTVVSLSGFWSADIDWGALNLDNYRELRENEFFWPAITNSLKLALLATIVSTVIAFALALVIERRQRGAVRTVTEFVVQLPLSIPAVLFGLGILLTFGFTRFTLFGREVNLYGHAGLLVLAYVVLTLPQAVRNIQAGLSQLDGSLERAAEVAGATRRRVYLDITVPLIRQSALSAAVMAFILTSREFAASVLLSTPQTQTMAPLLYNLYVTGTYPPVAALAMVMVVISGIGVLLILVLGGRDALERM
jgi:iron(III) transport system permease protein